MSLHLKKISFRNPFSLSKFGITFNEYYNWQKNNLVIIAQIENISSIEHLDEIFGSNVLTNKQKHDNQNDNNNGGVKSSDGGDQDLKNVDFSLFQAETEIDIS